MSRRRELNNSHLTYWDLSPNQFEALYVPYVPEGVGQLDSTTQ